MESGKNQGQIIRQLDKVNAKLKDQDKGSINLKSGAANMLIRQANKNRTNLLGRRDFEFGTGRIGQQLGDMSGLNTPITSPNRRCSTVLKEERSLLLSSWIVVWI
jgi:hypothetical protein